jgi:hypothetical protein
MESNERGPRRNPAAELGAQLVWVVGTLASYFVGALYQPWVGVAALSTTFGVVLLLARLSAGWHAVPAMFATLLLQAPLLVGLGLYAIGLPIGHDPWPCYFWYGTDLELLEVVVCIMVLASPVGFMLRLGRRGLGRVRWFARGAAPLAVVASLVLVVLGGVRLSQLPAVDRYLESLPVHATLPPPGEPCTPIEDKRDPKHDPGYDDREACATPDVDAQPLSFHYHVRSFGGTKRHSLHMRTKAGRDRAAGVWYWASEPPEIEVRRDDALDAWLLPGRWGAIRVLTLDGWRDDLHLRDLSGRVAPPLGWMLVAAGGLLVAIASLGASWGLGRFAAGRRDAHRDWVAARHGDLSLIALASALCSSALLAAALLAGFLV